MKKILSIILGAVALLITSSCAEEINGPGFSDNGKERIITVIATDKPAVDEEDSKTFIDGHSVKWSETGESLKVYEVATPEEGAAITSSAVSSEGVTTDSGATMSFGVSLADKSGGSYTAFDYYAVYPSSAVQSGSSVGGIALNTSASQTPSATNFDASQDLLIAKKVENGATQASTLLMQFARVVAIGKMTIKNLESEDPITKITFSAKVGEEPIALAGRTNFNLETAKPVSSYASNTQDYSIILNYDGQSITANTAEGMVAYFTCYPFAINSSTPGSFKVVVETATQTFTKEVSVSSAKGLAFNIGKASVFSVDMDNIAGVAKAVDLCYAYLDYADYTAAGGDGSYGNHRVAKAHDDVWITYAHTSNGAIGLGNGGDSYIQLPLFEQNIKTVVVTLKSAVDSPDGKKLYLAETSTGAVGSAIATEDAAADKTVFTFDLTSLSKKTAYLRSSGAHVEINKIEVYAGTDTRTAYSAPATVTASRNTGVGTSIDVSWSEVTDASGYVITLVPTSGETVVVTRPNSPLTYTVANLQETTEYTISVQALPADAYLNTISVPTASASTVTTTTGTNYATVETSNVTLAGGTNGSDATVNGKTAIKVGTSSAGGSMTVTIPANTVKLHVHAAAWNGVSNLSLNITGATVSPTSIELNPNTGIANSSPFTLSNTPSDDPAYYYFEIDVSGVTEETTLTFTSSITKRFVVWGVNAVADARPSAPIAWKKGEDIRTTASVKKVDDSYTWLDPDGAQPTLTITTPLDKAVTYSSSVTSVATINSSTGVISLADVGSTEITATYEGAEGDTYRHTEVSYTLTVTPYYAVTFNSTPDHGSFAVKNGETTISSGNLVPADATINITDITPEDGYALATLVYNDGSDHDIKAAKTFTMPAQAVSVTATFEVSGGGGTQDYTVTWTASSGALGSTIGSVNGTATGTIYTAAAGGTPTHAWTYTRTLVSLASGKSDYVAWEDPVIHLGSGNALESLVFTTSNIPGTVKSISVQCKGDKHKVSASVGGTSYISATNMTSSVDTYTNASVGSSSGAITISILPQGSTKKALYIQSITIVYNN